MHGTQNGICSHNGRLSCLLLDCALPSVEKGLAEERLNGGMSEGFSKYKRLLCFITHGDRLPKSMVLQEIRTDCTIKNVFINERSKILRRFYYVASVL
jgi:hypothetical protein